MDESGTPFTTKVFQVAQFFKDLLLLLVLTAWELATTFVSLIHTLFLSTTGYFILGQLLLGAIGIALVDHQVALMEALAHVWCIAQPFLIPVLKALEGLIPGLELIICLANIFTGFMRILIANALSLAINCTDSQNWLDAVYQLGRLALVVLQAVLDLLKNPFENSFVFFSDDPLMKTPWTEFIALYDFIIIQLDCQCQDLGPFFTFVIDLVRKDELGCMLHNLINAGIAMIQALFNILLKFQFPEFNLFFDRIILAVLCAGDWLDKVVIDFIFLFTNPTPAPDLSLFCVVSRLVAVFIEVVALVVNSLSTFFNNGFDIVTIIRTAPLEDLVGRIYQLALCVQSAVGTIDSCLGEAAGAVIRTVASLVEFLGVLIQDGKFEFLPVSQAFFDIWGKQTFDQIGMGTHVVPCLIPPCFHVLAGSQTGLVCFVSNILGGSNCARAFSDLASVTGQLFLTIPLIANQILTLDYTTINFVGNPLASNNRALFTDIVLSIVQIPTDRILSVMDYFGHFIWCVPGLQDFGTAIVTFTSIVDQQVDNVITFIVSTLELIAQIVIWFIALLGASPFDGSDAGTELITLFDIFKDWFIQILDMVVEFLKGFVDYGLFPFFPEFFGQNSLFASTNPGTAKFTECFVEIGDCLCGLTKNSIGKICFGELGCLSHWWPDCNDFEPERKRFVEYIWNSWTSTNTTLSYVTNRDETIWYFWASRFNHTICGPVFNAWYENPPAPETSVGESDGMELINCVNMIIASGAAASTISTSIPSSFFMTPKHIQRTGRHLGEGLNVASSVALSNAVLAFADPSTIQGLPDYSAVYYNLSQELAIRGINDTIAVNTITSGMDMIANITGRFKSVIVNTSKEVANEGSLARETAMLVLRSADWLAAGSSLTVNIMYESHRKGIASQVVGATKNAFAALMYRAVDGETEKRQDDVRERTRKRYVTSYQRPVGESRWKNKLPKVIPVVHDANYTAELHANYTQLMSQYVWPMPITATAIMQRKLTRVTELIGEYKAHLTGNPTRAPLRNEKGELENTIPFSCTTILTNCTPVSNGNCPTVTTSVSLGCQVPSTTCTGETVYIEHFRVCNEFFGGAIVAGLCNTQDNGANATIIDFYFSMQDCIDAVNNVIPRNPPAQITAAFDTYTCFDTTTNPYDPFATSNLGTLCLPGFGCGMCPTNQFIPGFTCELMDNTISDISWLGRRCIDKLGGGPPLPVLPENITAWQVHIVNVSAAIHITRNRCGNGEIETNYTVTYRNPLNKVVFNFTGGEQCDPPLTYTTMNVSGENITVYCGPACQLAYCGNGIIDPGEDCDNGGIFNTFRCSASCKFVICGNGRIDVGEDCDDGNKLSYDGCSDKCINEICPRLGFTQSIDSPNSYIVCPANFTGVLEASNPHMCFNFGGYSALVHCEPRIPLLWTHRGDGCSQPPKPMQITEPCATTNAVCIQNQYISDPSQCAFAVQVGLDFSCTKNCSFCGNNIIEAGEECDDGTVFPTGIPSEDLCVNCHFVCTCHPDPRVPCLGTCAGGSNNGQLCFPRNPAIQCGNGGTCLSTQCCGDNITQGGEVCDTPDPFVASSYPGASILYPLCQQCQPVACSCQPGMPCMGECVEYSYGFSSITGRVPDSVWGSFESQSPGSFGTTIPCDMSQEPFACPKENQICVPKYCCGGGSFNIDSNGKDLCDTPGVSGCPTDCNMYSSTGIGTMRYEYNGDEYEIINRRELCTGVPFYPTFSQCKPNAGYPSYYAPCPDDPNANFFGTPYCESGLVCGTPNGNLYSPTTLKNFTNRVGMCFDEFGYAIRPALYCNRNLNATCDHLGIPNSYCVSSACCGDAIYDWSRIEDPDTIDRITDFTAGVYTGNPTCNYEKIFPSYDSCTCQPGKVCVGQCTYGTVATDLLCDPVNITNSPWCPTTTDPLYDCVPRICCGDGIVQDPAFNMVPSNQELDRIYTAIDDNLPLIVWRQQFFTPARAGQITNINTWSRYTSGTVANLPPEACDPLCTTQYDCGLGANLVNEVWTQCNVDAGHNYSNNGYFAPQDGVCINPITGTSNGAPCSVYTFIDNGNYLECMPGETCWFKSCCGDGIRQYPELCDNGFTNFTACNETCGLPITYFGARRKRDLPDTSERYLKNNSKREVDMAEELGAGDPRQIYYLEEHGKPTHNYTINSPITTLSALDDPLAKLVFDAGNYIAGRLGFNTDATGLFTTILDFFEKTETNPFTPKDQQGALFWARFFVSCKQPVQTDCVQGVGAVQAIKDLLPFYFWGLVIVGISTMWLGGTPGTMLAYAAGLTAFSIFCAHAFHYSFPYCTPLIPECAPREVYALLSVLNTTFPTFYDALIVSTNSSECTAVVADCRDFGLINGLDYFALLLQRWFPSWMETFYNSFLYTVLALIPYVKTSLDRVHYVPNPIPADVIDCSNFLSFFAIPQLVGLGALATLLGGYLVLIISNFITRLFALLFSGISLIMVLSEETKYELIT